MSQTRDLGRAEKKKVPPLICNVVVPTLLSTKSPINTDLLKKAVYHFITVQPNLSAGIKEIDGIWKFVPLKLIDNFFEVLPDTCEWKDVCLKYSNGFLREPSECEFYPPLKVFFIKQSIASAYFIPVYLHYAADGINGMYMVHDILKNYTKLCKGEKLDATSFPPPPSVDDMALSGLTDSDDELREKFELHQRVACKSLNFSFPFEEISGAEALYYTSTANEYENFLSACRHYQVTVGAALTASLFFGFGGYMFQTKPDCPEELKIGINIPINLRDRVPNNIASNCCNLTVTHFLLVRPITKLTKFWELARQIREVLLEKMNEQHKFYLFDFGCNEGVCSSEERKDAKEKHGVPFHSYVSNMKRFPGPVDFGEFSVESIHCAGGTWLTGRDVMDFLIYSTNKFNLSIVHRKGVKNKKRAEHVFEYVKQIVESASKWKQDKSLENCARNVNL
ncbi:uncharacterized protein LOC130612497 [Hydractinia symbiolongicarpus]|uniref:uncharacterized protein LOC130612497 n=1 Tax=Hydractinia symbiolongicarpus TaxID=13093 RepID=UPI002549ED24|nr:uncharacterized protein LOC130612497 [Hydractinia symbiolongicarpus]